MIYLLKKKYLYWSILILTFILFRIPIWSGSDLSDFWVFNYVGHDWLSGGKLYVSAWDHKAPLIFLIYGIYDKLWGTSLIFTQVFTTSLVILDTLFFYKIAKLWFNNDINKTKIALLVYVVARNLPFLNLDGSTTENYTIIFMNIGFWLFLKYRNNLKPSKLFLIGLMFGLVFWLKANCFIFALPICYLIYREAKNKLLTVINLFLPLVLLGLIHLGYFSLQGTLRDFYIAAFEYNSKYNLANIPKNSFKDFVKIRINTLVSLIPFVPISIYYFWKQKFSILHCYLLLFAFFIIITFGFNGYYYLPFVTVLSLVTVYAFDI